MASTPTVNRRQFLVLDMAAPAPNLAVPASLDTTAPASRAAATAIDSGHWIRVHRRIMACRFEVVLPGEHVHLLSAARTALNLADRLEARLSVFRETSELSHVNRVAGEAPVAVHPGLYELLRRSHQLHAATGGAFDITSTPLSRCWGFLRREGQLPPMEQIARAREAVGMNLVELDDASHTVRFLRRGVELNLGSIGKGHALDVMGRKLRRLGVSDALISAGGSSILAIGADGGGWPVDLTSSLCEGRRLARLRLRDAAMATSGAGEQFVLVGDRRYGHVIDPRTGWPAAGVLSATIVTHEASVADALATACLIDGESLASRYCATHPGTLAVLVLDDEARSIRMFGACDGASLDGGLTE